MKTQIKPGEAVIIATFACLGKTTFAKKYPLLALDIESIYYAYIYDEPIIDEETAKNASLRSTNPNFPQNYICNLLENYGKYKFIFVTLSKEILAELDKLNLKYTIIYPSYARKEKILHDAKNRGNNPEFIKMLDELLSGVEHRDKFHNGLNYAKFEILDDNLYLEDYIKSEYEYGK